MGFLKNRVLIRDINVIRPMQDGAIGSVTINEGIVSKFPVTILLDQ